MTGFFHESFGGSGAAFLGALGEDFVAFVVGEFGWLIDGEVSEYQGHGVGVGGLDAGGACCEGGLPSEGGEGVHACFLVLCGASGFAFDVYDQAGAEVAIFGPGHW